MTFPDTTFTTGTTITSNWLNAVNDKCMETISVKDFGAVGDGVTDDTAAIQTGIDAALAAGQTITAYGTFKITSKIVIKGDTDFSQATFNVYGTPAVAVEVSTGNASNPTTELNNCVIWLPKRIENMTKPATGWAGQGIGVRTVNTYSCQIFVGNIVNFATGLLLTSYNTNGNTYNNYYLGSLENNQVNLALTPGDSTSWANENNFYGGRFSQYSGEGTNVSGVRHILLSKSTNSVNNNMFTKPSLEGDTPEYHVENGGAYNTILQGRWEATTPKVLYIADNAGQGTANDIISGYDARSIQFTFSGTSGFQNRVFGADQNNYDTLGGSTGSYKMMNVGSSSYPIHTFYEASTVVRPENATSSQWAVQHSAQFLQAKRTADAYARVKLDYVNGGIGFTNGAVAPANQLFSNGSADNLYVQNALAFVPYPNNTLSLGASSYKWTVVYATTGTINTSDANQKQNIEELDDAEKRVALAIKKLIKKFKFKDAVVEKSEKARIHIGVIAQEVKSAFDAEGLDATQYALFCSDILEDGTEQLGIRYEELLAFIIGAI